MQLENSLNSVSSWSWLRVRITSPNNQISAYYFRLFVLCVYSDYLASDSTTYSSLNLQVLTDVWNAASLASWQPHGCINHRSSLAHLRVPLAEFWEMLMTHLLPLTTLKHCILAVIELHPFQHHFQWPGMTGVSCAMPVFSFPGPLYSPIKISALLSSIINHDVGLRSTKKNCDWE